MNRHPNPMGIPTSPSATALEKPYLHQLHGRLGPFPRSPRPILPLKMLPDLPEVAKSSTMRWDDEIG